ncbi:hypothetical protein DRE_01119 [Drechslerella stenobrocha 248]|uniref:Insecticide toxin TcdB middle/N-terminal domain-containing protein n=1 Tax=Drechslerella stenobrocha 248 TaxID=1043628 RepID=W7HWI8_9PEZI|nr:hypothetical protein DRE_01119 [Drechslerella stenobrocha 248]
MSNRALKNGNRGVRGAASTQPQDPQTPGQGSKEPQNGPNQTKSGANIAPAPGISNNRGGGSHASISPKFDLNPVTGTMSLSLPIHTSSTRANFGPSLALNYDSGSGNGAFGIGWHLSPLSVSRKVSKGIPEYNERDVFTLSGHDDLVPWIDGDKKPREMTVDGYLVNRFRPRVEGTFIRIEYWQDISNPNETFWKTISEANVATFYGESDESRIFDGPKGGPKRIFSWLECRSYDSFGNAVEIKYKPENSDGIEGSMLSEFSRHEVVRTRSRYIKAVKYGNRTPSRDLVTWKPKPKIADADWMFEVVFDYGEHDEDNPTPKEDHKWTARRFPFSFCNSGFEVRTYRLCKRVLMFHHLPEEIGQDNCLVASTCFKYDEREGMELLTEFVSKGHIFSKERNGYITQTLPPLTLRYTKAKDATDLSLEATDGSLLHHYNYNPADVKLVDLFGDGAPGILHAPVEGAWTYQRNQMLLPYDEHSFGPPKVLTLRPSGSHGQEVHFEDINHDGNMDVVLTDTDGRLTGYHEYTSSSGWANFSKFERVPNFSLSSDETKIVDIDGDGLADVVNRTDTGDILWYKNLGKSGFAAGSKLPFSDAQSHIHQSGEDVLVTFADMSGDGLSDLVEIRNGMVSYWPNLGNGHFCTRVQMDNSPFFARRDAFNTKRVHLADVNGSGTTDLLYLPEEGGVNIYYNIAGNSWGSCVEVACFPSIDSLSSIFTLDLLGNGTSCLCFLGITNSFAETRTLSYIDLVGGQKPYLLESYSTGLGSTSSISYKPSTSFSLADELSGNPWRTKLPFPVHCVSRITVKDELAQTSVTTRFAYHDGFYDGFEREFRGFGIVESWDEAEFSADSSGHFQRPPVRTKSWFHVGSSDFEVEGYGTLVMPENLLPDMAKKSEGAIHEIHRTLKGSLARKELYSDDGSKLAGIPYNVIAHSYEVRELQPGFEDANAVFQIIPRETVSHHYERDTAAPRINHAMVLEVDDYGNQLKSLTLQHGIPNSTLPELRDMQMQEATWASYREQQFTRPFDEVDYFLHPQQAVTKGYSITGLSAGLLENLEFNTTKIMEFLDTIQTVSATTVPKHSDTPQKALIEESRIYFSNCNITKRLPLREIEPFSPTYRSYKLAFTSDTLKVFSENDILRSHSLEALMKMGGYTGLDLNPDEDSGSNGAWWLPSEQVKYDLEDENCLARARASFYTPCISVDPFNNTTTLTFDDYHFLLESITDPVGNRTTFKNDYIQLQAVQLTDPNGNRTDTIYDCFGSVTGVALVGKTEQSDGDSLEGFEAILSEETLRAFIQDPSDQTCRSLLGKAGRRLITHPTHYRDKKEGPEATVSPSFTAEITSDVHGNQRGPEAKIYVKITYLDGGGGDLQTVSLNARPPENVEAQWLVDEWLVKDSKGKVVRECRPKFAPDHHFTFASNADAVKCTNILDPLDRVIGTLRADHTWDKTIELPWSKTGYSTSHIIQISDPSSDPHVGPFITMLPKKDYLPTWLQQQEVLAKSDAGNLLTT